MLLYVYARVYNFYSSDSEAIHTTRAHIVAHIASDAYELACNTRACELTILIRAYPHNTARYPSFNMLTYIHVYLYMCVFD